MYDDLLIIIALFVTDNACTDTAPSVIALSDIALSDMAHTYGNSYYKIRTSVTISRNLFGNMR